MPGKNQTLLLNSLSSNAEELHFYSYSIVLNSYRVLHWGTHERGRRARLKMAQWKETVFISAVVYQVVPLGTAAFFVMGSTLNRSS